jgi:dCTP deaminase
MDVRCIWFLFQRAVETVLRFGVYLDRVQNLSASREVNLLRFFRYQNERIRQDLSDQVKQLTRYNFEGTINERDKVRRFLYAYAQTVTSINGSFRDLDYLPNQPPVPSGVYILLRDLFPATFHGKTQPTVVYHRKYDFEQRTYRELQAEVSGAPLSLPVVLRMPYVEFRNPLMWVNLTHEMGHALDATTRLSAQFVASSGVKLHERAIVENWASELLADRVAINVVGPAYLSAFISWYLTRYPAELTQSNLTHPAPADRLATMREHLRKEGVLCGEAEFALRVFDQVAENLPQLQTNGKESPSLPVQMSIGKIAKWADSQIKGGLRLQTFGPRQRKAADAIQANLTENIVASSRGRIPLKKLQTALETETFDTPEKLYRAAARLNEVPNHSCEIANAAWDNALSSGLNEFHRVFSQQSSTDEEKWSKYREYLLAFQRRLRKSIEHARIHSLWRKYRKSPSQESHAISGVDSSKLAAPKRSPRPSRGEPTLLTEKQILSRLCRRDKGRIVVTPILDMREQIQPSSLDLRLGSEFAIVRSARLAWLDILQDTEAAEAEIVRYLETVHISPEEKFILHPHDFALGCTLEYIRLPFDIAGRLEGKSTWGRVGLQIHSTAGFVDPGFEGALTFELQNVGRVPIPLYPAMRVAQICFYEVEESSIPYPKKAHASYGGHPGLITSKYFKLPDIEILQRIHPRARAK